MLEAGVDRSRIYEMRKTKLLDVAEALKGGRIHQPQRDWINPDVVPQRIADDLELKTRHDANLPHGASEDARFTAT